MGLFDSLAKKIQNATNTKMSGLSPKKETQKQSQIAKQIISLYYADYPEIPYVSNERQADWIEKAQRFPKQSVIPKSTMKRFSDGLLPGHIYMLYWLKKYTNKTVPSYFEYKYGIDFEKEKNYLYGEGYLDIDNKPTTKGEAAIEKHYSVIKNHTPPKPDLSIEGISKRILAQRDSFLKNGFKEYTFIANKDCCDICARLNGKHFAIKDFKIGVTAPPMHDKCKCSIAAYEDDSEYNAWLDFLDKGGTSKQWETMQKKNSKRW